MHFLWRSNEKIAKNPILAKKACDLCPWNECSKQSESSTSGDLNAEYANQAHTGCSQNDLLLQCANWMWNVFKVWNNVVLYWVSYYLFPLHFIGFLPWFPCWQRTFLHTSQNQSFNMQHQTSTLVFLGALKSIPLNLSQVLVYKLLDTSNVRALKRVWRPQSYQGSAQTQYRRVHAGPCCVH